MRIPPTVHGDGDKAMVPRLIIAPRKKNVAGYVNQGCNRLAAAHKQDVARLFGLALEEDSLLDRWARALASGTKGA